MTDGTTGGTKLLRTIDGLNSLNVVAWGDTILYAQNDPATGSELWRTDGTPAGTRMVADIAPGSSSSLNSWTVLVRSDGVLIRANDRRSGYEPWFTDGTAAGTRLVRNVAQDANSSSVPRNIAVRGETLFFFASDADGLALWTFSERNGSRRVASVKRPYGTQDGVVSGNLYYFSQGDTPPVELWRSDGTAEGTFKLLTTSQYFGELVPFRGGLLFKAHDPEHGYEPWFTDGTSAGTRMVGDLIQGSSGSMAYGEMFAASDGYAYLFAANAVWRTSLSQDGTIKLVGNQAEGERFDYVTAFAELKGTVYFINRLHDSAFSLWATDGTPTGTRRVLVLEGHYPPFHLRSSGTRLFFLTQNSGVWSSDGTKDGTLIVSPRRAGWCAFKDAESFATLNGIFYWVSQYQEQAGLWRSDGTAEGTYQLSSGPFGDGGCGEAASLVAADDHLFFSGWDETHGFELWRSDGTREGTGRIADIAAGEKGSDPRELRLLGSRIYFRAYTAETGSELFRCGLRPAHTRGARR
jgi:ELWxxDGT repeat protein